MQDLLRDARIEAGITQQLATTLGRPQSFVYKYESGKLNLDVADFTAICRALRLNPDQEQTRVLQFKQKRQWRVGGPAAGVCRHRRP